MAVFKNLSAIYLKLLVLLYEEQKDTTETECTWDTLYRYNKAIAIYRHINQTGF